MNANSVSSLQYFWYNPLARRDNYWSSLYCVWYMVCVCFPISQIPTH